MLEYHINLEKKTAFYTDYNCSIRTLNYIYIFLASPQYPNRSGKLVSRPYGKGDFSSAEIYQALGIRRYLIFVGAIAKKVSVIFLKF